MPERLVAGQRVALATGGSDEFRRVGSSVLGERRGHLMKDEWPWHDTYGGSDGHAHHH
jgi:hypothetical protein